MKKLIITTAIAITASLSFFAYQGKAVSNTQQFSSIKLSAEDRSDFNPVKTGKMDVIAADIK